MDRFSDRGSTPLISTKNTEHPLWVLCIFELIWRESNGSVVNFCRWQEEPTLTEPAGENSTPLISTRTSKSEPLHYKRVVRICFFYFDYPY